MKVIYHKGLDKIIGTLGDDQDLDLYYKDEPKEFIDNLSSITIQNKMSDLWKYRIIDSKLVIKSDEEIQDILIYGRILSQEEKILMKLTPPLDEIRKAETTIEVLSLLQEVL